MTNVSLKGSNFSLVLNIEVTPMSDLECVLASQSACKSVLDKDR